jgi:alpha-tubulin suppressor-like RCC1 family protein
MLEVRHERSSALLTPSSKMNSRHSVASIDMGFWHTCAALQNGQVRCWGRNSSSELGYPGLESVGDNEAPASAGDVQTH